MLVIKFYRIISIILNWNICPSLEQKNVQETFLSLPVPFFLTFPIIKAAISLIFLLGLLVAFVCFPWLGEMKNNSPRLPLRLPAGILCGRQTLNGKERVRTILL
ncbi:hypothetical protein NPIL_139831 [Nephila pilipes]|uniref:Uncharacterized protein n=1 Tax=Nephila pilipes TaxID=299642 RepID=A0A8X6TIY5_NEPPI|nr:hypothetical protein NPIL_139831 [Nephila pilipes]